MRNVEMAPQHGSPGADGGVRPRARAWLVGAALAVTFAAAAWPLILSGYARGRGEGDQNIHYLRAIRRFSEHGFNISDYESATTPGYLLVVALIDRTVTHDVRYLRLAGSLITVALVGAVGLHAGRRMSRAGAFAVTLPFVASLYVFSSGAWLLPDNAGWLGVWAVLTLGLRGDGGVRTYAVLAAALLLLVFVRQVHLWAAAVPVGVAALAWSAGRERMRGDAPLGAGTAAAAAGPGRAVACAALAVVPPVLLTACFYVMWGGLTPPSYQGVVQGVNFATPAFLLSIVAIISVFYSPYLLPFLAAADLRSLLMRVLIPGAVCGLIVSLLPATTYQEPTRMSGLWHIVRRTPSIGRHSPLIIALATFGAASLAAWLAALRRDERVILGLAFVAFAAAQTATALAWQRYHEPFVLILFALAACHVSLRWRPSAWAVVGPLALAGLLAAVTVVSLRNG